jgi:hypothetical protein
MIGFVSKNEFKSAYLLPPPSRERAADIEQIPLELLKLFNLYRYKSPSEIAVLLRQLGIREIFTNGLDQPSYDPKKAAEKLITQKHVNCPVTPPQARWFVDELLTMVSQIFEQENGDNLVAKRLLDTVLNRIQGKKEIILRNGRDKLDNHTTDLLEWIMIACESGNIPLSSEEEQILKKYVESRKMSARTELNQMRRRLG